MKRTFSSTSPTVMRVCTAAAKGKSDPTPIPLQPLPTFLRPPPPFIHLNIKILEPRVPRVNMSNALSPPKHYPSPNHVCLQSELYLPLVFLFHSDSG